MARIGRVLAWIRTQRQIWNRFDLRSRVKLVAILYIAVLLPIMVVGTVQFVPIWVAAWQGAHGHYPSGHLTYTVPDRWDVTTLTNLNPSGSEVWWSAFDDTVTIVSPTYDACYTTSSCGKHLPNGARVDLESSAGRGQPTIEAWYQIWVQATIRRFGPDAILPLADFTHVFLGGETALCATNQAGSLLLPPHPSPSTHFDTTFPGYVAYGGAAVLMCFALWQGRAYYVEVTVQLHTTSQDTDLRDATLMIESLRFT